MCPQEFSLESRLKAVYQRDRFRLQRLLSKLRKEDPKGLNQAGWDHLEERIVLSEQTVLKRLAERPKLQYPEELPIALHREEILKALKAHSVIIVCGETGSGKTTQLPKICLEAGLGTRGLIGHTQPRRIAARSVAHRIAEELGQKIGETVGYKVRFQDQTHPNSLIKLMTDGILLAESQQDRFLDQYDTLIIDEAHERSLNIDFLMGYLRWLLPKRPDLKVIITSATIDPERFSEHFGGAPIIRIPGRTYPVEIRYRPVEVEEGDETDALEQKAILDAVDELWREVSGDLLIFLSGEREIRETAEALRKHHPAHAEILPLFSRLSQSEQDRVFKPERQRRIVLATNVAETSLTVPGIRGVIDAGFARMSRYSHRSKLQRLPIERISKASANQRSGRCGRIGPGIAIRLYSEEDFVGRPEFTEPEILRTNLAAVILRMHALRLGEIERFPFVEPPDGRLIRDGIRALIELGALKDGSSEGASVLTERGVKLAKFPVDPRLGRMLLAAQEEGCLSEMAIIVSALSVPDPRERPQEKAQLADQRHAVFKDDRSDFISLLNLWRAFQGQKHEVSRAKLRAYCRDHFLSYVRMLEWQEVHAQLLEILKGELSLSLNTSPSDFPEIHRALLTGLLSQVCVRQEQGDYLGARGVRLSIHPGSSLAKSKPKWIVSAEQVETSKVFARLVAGIQPEWIEQAGEHLLKRHYYDPHWERKTARVMVHERTTLFGLTVQAGRKVPYERVDRRETRELLIRHALVQMEYDSRASFFTHNLKTLEAAEYLQQKGRRVDLVVDDAWLFAFFDQKLPEHIVDGPSFERWRKKAEAINPELLKLRVEDITLKQDPLQGEVRYPDFFQLGPLRIPLAYRFEPGHPEDGITALIPIHLLNQIAPEPFEWLVPGLLEEKVQALIKSLPKTYRIHFVPVPTFAQSVLPMLDYAQGSLRQQLSSALKRTGGIQVPVDAFREEQIPLHLRMAYALVDQEDRVIERTRDLAALKQGHRASSGQSFQKMAGQVWLRQGSITWDFEDLPACFDGNLNGQPVYGFPAIVDEGKTVGVRLYPTPIEAAQIHAEGLIRLLRCVLVKDLKYLKKQLRISPQVELAYQKLPGYAYPFRNLSSGRDLKEDVIDCLLALVFLEGKPEIRTRAEFDLRLKQAGGELLIQADRVITHVSESLLLSLKIRESLAACKLVKVKTDLESQWQRLLFSGFLAVTPWEHLQHFPRYLKAMLHRLEKSAQDPARDQRQFQELQPLLERYERAISEEGGLRVPENDAYRWALEEYRVSLFAQHLKTAYPVSPKRMQEFWLKRALEKE